MPEPVFNPEQEIPDLKGKVIVVTGGTNGLGRESVISFAAHGPRHIFFTGRSQAAADSLIKDLTSKHADARVTFVRCDLANLASVQDAAREIVSKTDRLDILLANAGIMAVPPGLTSDGYEIQFGTNHVGHALLAKLLTPLMEKTAGQTESPGDVRIVWNTSLGYQLHPAKGILFDKLKTSQADISLLAANWTRYGQSKLANLLYARAYAKHHPSIASVSIHPGVSATGLVTSLSLASRLLVYATNIGKMLSPEACAWNQQWAATAPFGKELRQVESGVYYEPIGLEGDLTGQSSNDELAEELWSWTQRELQGYGR